MKNYTTLIVFDRDFVGAFVALHDLHVCFGNWVLNNANSA